MTPYVGAGWDRVMSTLEGSSGDVAQFMPLFKVGAEYAVSTICTFTPQGLQCESEYFISCPETLPFKNPATGRTENLPVDCTGPEMEAGDWVCDCEMREAN